MCGLVTILSPAPLRDWSNCASAMLDLLAHRGPDDRQVMGFDDKGQPTGSDRPASLVLGHLRLAVQDLSDAGRQPMGDSTGRFRLSFNGEIYNFTELGEELTGQGVRLTSHCDAEVLLHVLAREWTRGLSRLDGMFAIFLLDRERGVLLVARDHVGIKPLYHWTAPDGCLVFASEIKAFTAYPGWSARLNGQRAFDYLTRGLIDHTTQTMFAGVSSVPAGSFAEIDLRGQSFRNHWRRWFDLRDASIARRNGDDHTGRLRELLTQSVARQLRADVDVGSCLSGGLDSSSIVCLTRRALRGRGSRSVQRTFTARSPVPAEDEWSYAALVAERAGVEAIPVCPDGRGLFENLERLVWTQDEPFGSPSVFLQDELFRAAAMHGIKVMLDGQGADEQLAGYHSFFKVHLWDILQRGRHGEFVSWLRDLHTVHGMRTLTMLGQVAAIAAPLRWRRRMRSQSLAFRLVDHQRLEAEPVDPLDELPGRASGVATYSLEQLERTSLPMLLHWEDRSSMAHGVEARVPFLAPEFLHFTRRLPAEARLHRGMTKHVLREAMKGIVPEAVRLRRDKIAFAAPEPRWLCDEHRESTRAALDQAIEVSGGILRRDQRAVLDDMLEHRRPYDNLLWRVICFGAWARRFNLRA